MNTLHESGAEWPSEFAGLRLDDYEIVAEVGRGAMGTVYKARQLSLDRVVALKLLRLPKMNGPETENTLAMQWRLRFTAEAATLARLDHPGIVPVYAFAHDAHGQPYITMRLIDGTPLKSIIECVNEHDQKWPIRRVIEVLARAAETLAFAHERGVVHRDLKPAHVLVGLFGEVYVLDWGLAKVRKSGDAVAEEPHQVGHVPFGGIVDLAASHETGAANGATLGTLPGEILGTPQYMSPEQARGDQELVGPPTDIYAVGAILYHLLQGYPPYGNPTGERMSALDILQRVQTLPPAPLRRRRFEKRTSFQRELGPELRAICKKAMQRNPVDRYATMAELADDLRAVLEVRVVRALHVGRASRLAKWGYRHRAALIGVVLGSIYADVRMGMERSAATQEEVRANVRSDASDAYQNLARAGLTYSMAAQTYFVQLPVLMGEDARLKGRPLADVPLVEFLDQATVHIAETNDLLPRSRTLLLALLGRWYAALGRAPKAMELLETARSVTPPEWETPADLTLLTLGDTWLATQYSNEGRFEDAEHLWRDMQQRHERLEGENGEFAILARANVALCLLGQKRPAEAAQIAADALARYSPSGSQRWFIEQTLAQCEYSTGQEDVAVERMRRLYAQCESQGESSGFIAARTAQLLAAMYELSGDATAAKEWADRVPDGILTEANVAAMVQQGYQRRSTR